MNKAKAYSYLGAMLGTGIGFGVGYGVGLLETARDTAGTSEIVNALLIWGYLFLILIMAGTILIMYDTVDPPDVEADVASWGVAVVLIMGAFCIFFVFGVEPTRDFFRGTSLFLLVLAIPFSAFGTTTGYRVGRSIGKKADEREQEKRLYQQKIDAYRRKLRQWDAEGYKVEELKKKWGFK